MTVDLGRRRLLAGAGAAAALALAACSGDAPAAGDVDLDFAGVAAGVEKLALNHYTDLGMALAGGRLGALVPPALGALVATATGHHRQAHDAWNKVRAGGGRAEVTAPGSKLQEALNTASLRQTDVPAAVKLAVGVEDYAGQTYQRALPTLAHPDTVRLAAQLSVAGHQRLTVLRYLLGADPVVEAGADPRLRLITG